MDVETFARVFGRCDWAVMLIVARGGASCARISFGVGPGGGWEIPLVVDFETGFAGSDHAGWLAEYERCVVARSDLPGEEDYEELHPIDRFPLPAPFTEEDRHARIAR